MAAPAWRFPTLPALKTGIDAVDRLTDQWRNILNPVLRIGTSAIQGAPVPAPTPANDQQVLLYDANSKALVWAGQGGGVLPAPGTAGNVLTSTGTVWQSEPSPAPTYPTTVAEGGTGATTAGGARTNLGAAASGANSDITSLSGLTTPLPAGEGGTGLTTPGTAGNVLTSTGTAWVSSVAASLPWSYNTPPASPSVYDDEFNSTTLNTKWTAGAAGSGSPTFTAGTVNLLSPPSSPAGVYDLTSKPGWFLSQAYPGVNSQNTDYYFITQSSMTFPTNMVVTAHQTITGTDNSGMNTINLICLIEPVSGNQIQFGLSWNGSGELLVHVVSTAAGKNNNFALNSNSGDAPGQWDVYLALAKLGTQWSIFWSESQFGPWATDFGNGNETFADSTAFTQCQIITGNSGAGTQSGQTRAPVNANDFIRFNLGGTQLPGGG